MLELINGARAANGVAPVQRSDALADVASDAPYGGCGFPVTGRAADMGARNYFGHTIANCSGKGMTQMLVAAGVTFSGAAENIAWVGGMTDPLMAAQRLHNDLMGAQAHRDNVLNPAFTRVGVGSWQTAAGQTWSGGGAPMAKVWITAQIFADIDEAAPASGSGYHPLTPSRILDTRSGPGALTAGATMDVQVTGQGGVPSTGVSAVVLNVAVTGPTAPSYLTVYPSGEARPNASNLNFLPGQTVPNLVTAKVGSGGRLAVYNAAGSTHVIADIAGWYDTGGPGGAGYHPLTPNRIHDTRSGAVPLGHSATIDVQVTGRGGVPTTGVSAVVLNVAVTGPTAPSYLTVYPAGEARPNASNLNYLPGQTVPNLVVAKVGAGGKVSAYNAAGTTHVITDVAGWYDVGGSSTGGRFHPLTPSRILDTRSGGPVGAGASADLAVAGRGGVPSSGASAVVLNVTVTQPTAPSYLTVYPSGEAVPLAANLNFLPGLTVPNLVAAKLGADGRLRAFNAAGTTHVIADVAGWFDAV